MILKVPFELHGPHGVLKHLKYLLETKGSAVICVAEGAGQVSLFFLCFVHNKFCAELIIICDILFLVS